MIRHIVLRVTLKVHEKATNHQATEFVREALQGQLGKVQTHDRSSKMAHLEEYSVSVIEDRTQYQHD